MSDEMQTEQTEAPKRRGRPPGPDRGARGSRKTNRVERGRRERTPLGVQALKMQADIPDDLVGYWFNDDPGRIDGALKAGYVFYNDEGETEDRASARSMVVGTNDQGEPKRAYLMTIPKEWYEENQRAKAKPIDDFEAEINRGLIQGAEGQKEAGNFYNKGTVLERR